MRTPFDKDIPETFELHLRLHELECKRVGYLCCLEDMKGLVEAARVALALLDKQREEYNQALPLPGSAWPIPEGLIANALRAALGSYVNRTTTE